MMIKTLSDLNRLNRKNADDESKELRRLLNSSELAKWVAAAIRQQGKMGPLQPVSLLELARDIERTIRPERRKYLCRDNARRGRQTLHPIGPLIETPQGCPQPSYRVRWTVNGVLEDFYRRNPRTNAKRLESPLIEFLGKLADEPVKIVYASDAITPEKINRAAALHFKIEGHSYKVSFTSLERRFTAARRPQKWVC